MLSANVICFLDFPNAKNFFSIIESALGLIY